MVKGQDRITKNAGKMTTELEFSSALFWRVRNLDLSEEFFFLTTEISIILWKADLFVYILMDY